MKKLIALIGAVATAFGLYAATPYAVSFEANDPGVSEGVFTPPTGWTWTSTDTLNLGTYDGDGYLYPIEGAAARRSDSFKDKADQTSFLKLETGTNMLVREVGADNVFLDQLVKFTGYEEAPTLAAGTKIAVWMSGIEAEGTEGEDGYIAGETNLYVTCAKVAEGQVEPVALKLAAPGNKAWETDKWYRLTIKWIDDIYGGNGVSDPANTHARAGFIVYIDGTQVASSDAAAKSLIEYTNEMGTTAKSLMAGGQLFPAVDATNVDFASVGYQGIGSIDDIILDGQGPAFCAALNFNVAPGLGLKIVKVETEAGDEIKAPYAVVSGTGVKIYFGAADGYKVVSGKDKLVVNATITTEGQTVSSPAEGIETAEVVAQIIRQDQVAAEYAEVELDTAFAEVQDGDKIKFVKGCSAFSGKYVFPINATIDVTANGNWDIMVPGEAAELKDYVGAAPEKQITVTFTEDPDQSTFYLAGNIYGDGRVDTLVDVGGYTLLDGNLTIGNTFQAKDGAGAILRSVYIGGYDGDEVMGGSAKISLVGKGKVVTTTQLPDTAFAAAAAGYSVEETSEVIEETTWYTYALKGEAPAETGFAVIIAGVVSGTYPTLAEAVAEAPAGATIKLLSNEEVDSKCEITKNITLDLNGKTLARDNNAATLFVIKDVTLTINGETEGSTLVGRLNVGDSVYNGGVRTAHWDGALVINGGTYSVGNGQTVIHVNGDCLDAAVTINNATLTSPTDNGVQFNGKGTFAINNSTINGATAVYMKAGTLTIDKDSKINATAETWTAPVANHNGSNPTGDAIVMDSTTGYQGAISLTVAEGAQVTKVAEGAATIRETITDATESTTVKIDAPTIGGIALTEAFLAKVANGSAQLPGYVATIGTVPYPTLAAAFAAAQNDDTVEMLADVSLAANEKVVIMDKAVTLAGAFTVTAAGRAFNVQKGGTLTISSETTVIGTGKPATIFLWPYDFDSRALTSDDAAHYGKAKLVVNGTVKYTTTGNEGAIASNGNDSIAESEGVDVIINGTVINECDSALYLPGKGTCTVNDGAYIEGTYAGIQMKAVTLTVNGGTIKATGEDQTPTAPWADGANPSGCAIQMEGNTAYAGGINLTVNGGTIWSVNAKAIYAYGAQEKFGTISIAGGTIKGNTGVFLLDQGMNKAIVPGSSKAQFNQDVTDFCEEGYETVKLESAEFYTVRAKQTDPIPPLPAEPTADDVNTKVDAAKFADSTVKTMIGGDPAKYTAFKTWADTVTGGQAAVVASAHAADSYLLGQTTLLENAPVSKIKTIAKTSDTALTLTFEIKDGDNAVTVAQTAADYVKTLVQCNEKVDFGNGTKIDATVTVTISGTTLNAAVTLPANKPAAFMKVAK